MGGGLPNISIVCLVEWSKTASTRVLLFLFFCRETNGTIPPFGYARAKALYEQATATAPIESAAKAYYTLGTIYEQGRLGIPRDITEARTMYYYAAGLGHTGAKAKLRQMR